MQPSPHVLAIASMFGLGIDDQRELPIIAPIELPINAGEIVFITGASGSGKTSLLRCIESALADHVATRVIRLDTLPPPPDRPLVDCFGGQPLEVITRHLSLAGLGDAFVMLRRPGELSDGQRARLRLAQVFDQVERTPDDALCVVLADEFAATLDRITAAVIARNVRRWMNRHHAQPRGGRVCFVAATTHDDLLEPLAPDVLVDKPLGESIEVLIRPDAHRPAAEADG